MSQRPRSRAPELYGFVAWTTTSLLYVVYVLWAVLPDEWILAAGIDWYPNREWAVLVPAWTVVVVLLTYFSYLAIALFRTPALSDLSAVVDSKSPFPALDGSGATYTSLSQPDALPELYEIPIGMASRVLYDRDLANYDTN
ncbi:PIG-P [Flagelloscypha sp. PMI_526]|nr:PIG-P [Flagelloscypha sp. PMI_526]